MASDDVALFREKEEKRLRAWMEQNPSNLKALAEWSRYDLFGMTATALKNRDDHVERVEACLRYMLRQLSKGRIPRLNLVSGLLVGATDPPPCGYLGCTWGAEDHVH